MKLTIIYSAILLGFLLFLLPKTARAHEFYSLERGQVLEAGSAIYRLKPNQADLQLAELPIGTTFIQSLSFAGRIIAVGQTTEQFLLVSQDGLSWQPVSAVGSASTIKLTVFHEQLFVWREGTGGSELLSSSDGVTFQSTNIAALPVAPELNNFLWIDQRIVLAFQNQTEIDLFQLNGTVWQAVASITCPTSQVFHRPVDFLFCQDGRVLVPQTISNWLSLFTIPVGLPSVSDLLVVAPIPPSGAEPSRLAIWQKGQTQTWLVTSQLTSPIAQLHVSANRLLVRYASPGWYELLWQETVPEFRSVSPLATAVPVATANDPRLFISSGTGGFYSDVAGTWLPLTTPANSSFNHALRVPGGWLVWKTNDDHTSGGLTLFGSGSSPEIFSKVNRWSSTTSPIEAINIGTDINYVAVTNSSGRLNLYKSSSFLEGSWALVSLPTTVTFVRSPAEARLLAADSLVECRAIVRVLPGVVNAETFYLQDTNGGIQGFLDSSNGQLNLTAGQEMYATGTISSSQTKRIIIDDPAALEMITENNADPNWPTITPADVESYQGQVVWVQSELTDMATDWWQLGMDADVLKIHVNTATKPVEGDTIKVLAVIDWNSASEAVEGWALTSSFQVVVHPSPSPTPTVQPSPSPTVTITPTAQPTLVVNSTTNVATTTKTGSRTKAASKVTAEPEQVTANITGPSLVSAASSSGDGIIANNSSPILPSNTSPLTTILLLGSSLITGLLIGQGHRLRSWLGHFDSS